MTKEKFSKDHCPTCGEPLKKLERVIVDTESNMAILDDQALTLTSSQAIILDSLANKSPRRVTREQLMSDMYLLDVDEPDIKIIDIFVCKIRKLLVGTNYKIDSVWGKGYVLRRLRIIKEES